MAITGIVACGMSLVVIAGVIGVMVMASLDSGMSMLDVDTHWQMIVKGCILTLAVWVDVATRAGKR